MLARLVAQRMSMGQRAGRERRRGRRFDRRRSGRQGSTDGYTLLFHNITFSTTTSSGRHMPDAPRLETTSCRSRSAPMCRSGCWRPSVPAKPEGIRHLRQGDDHPLFYGSTGPGSIVDLTRRGAQTRHRHQDGSRAVPRRCAAGDRAVSGRIQFGGDQLSSLLKPVRSALKALAVATKSVACRMSDGA